jgi:hypothetical protein
MKENVTMLVFLVTKRPNQQPGMEREMCPWYQSVAERDFTVPPYTI